ncbi:MAG TPA: hypothetical protein PKA58_00660 [Polyangium sp.]|jgi:hypothetical protein|nr:hypothetical protein [Polyangium sp.]
MPSMVHISPPEHPHCGATSLQGLSLHTPLLELADEAEDDDAAVEDDDAAAPPIPFEDEPPAPPVPLPLLEVDVDVEPPVQSSSPPAPPVPPVNEVPPVAQAATAMSPIDVATISTSHRIFIVLPRRQRQTKERSGGKTLCAAPPKIQFTRAIW